MNATESFSVHTERDRDILRWLDAQDNKSEAIRRAIRAYIGGHGVTLADIHEAIMDLKRRRFTMTGESESVEIDEPPDIAATLDNLGRG
jgi:hypothetical protein